MQSPNSNAATASGSISDATSANTKCEKINYPSVETASSAGDEIIARGKADAMRVYFCLECQSFHVTRQTDPTTNIQYVPRDWFVNDNAENNQP